MDLLVCGCGRSFKPLYTIFFKRSRLKMLILEILEHPDDECFEVRQIVPDHQPNFM